MRAFLWIALFLFACGDDDSPAGAACGGFSGAVCGGDQYCDHDDDGCGAADGAGSCQARPSVCAPVLSPVCGCDGERYNNACEAQRAGTDVSTSTTCD